jgi:hypothetical protein
VTQVTQFLEMAMVTENSVKHMASRSGGAC